MMITSITIDRATAQEISYSDIDLAKSLLEERCKTLYYHVMQFSCVFSCGHIHYGSVILSRDARVDFDSWVSNNLLLTASFDIDGDLRDEAFATLSKLYPEKTKRVAL